MNIDTHAPHMNPHIAHRQEIKLFVNYLLKPEEINEEICCPFIPLYINIVYDLQSPYIRVAFDHQYFNNRRCVINTYGISKSGTDTLRIVPELNANDSQYQDLVSNILNELNSTNHRLGILETNTLKQGNQLILLDKLDLVNETKDLKLNVGIYTLQTPIYKQCTCRSDIGLKSLSLPLVDECIIFVDKIFRKYYRSVIVIMRRLKEEEINNG